MRQLNAFVKKEFMEQLRTGRFIVLLLIFCLFGIMNPAIAKITPWMMSLMSDQLAETGMVIGDIAVNAMTSWTQFFKNMDIVLIIFVIMFSGILTAEYQKGTLINVVTKGLNRWKILASKMTVMMVFWTFGCLLSYGITYGYNAFLWDNSIAHNIFFAAFCFYLLGIWLLTVILLASVLTRSASGVTLSTGTAFLVVYLLGLIPQVKMYVPAYLLKSMDLLTGTSHANDYFAAVAVTLIFIVVNIAGSVAVFNRRDI